MKKITKLGQLQNSESFLQVNTIKGFTYIDKAGEIVNIYHQKNTPPKFQMSLDGLIINNPAGAIEQLKVTPNAIWAKFTQIDSLDIIQTQFVDQVRKISDVLTIEKFSRVGWRNYFVCERDSLTDIQKILGNLTVLHNLELSSLTYKIDVTSDFKANLTVTPVSKFNTSTYGILFDIDVYEEKEVSLDEINGKFSNFLIYLRSVERFIEVINKILYGK